MRNRASMPTGVWLKILLLSVLFHLLLLMVFWPALRELFREPDVLPGMQFDVTVKQRLATEEAASATEEQEDVPEKEPPAEEESPEQDKPQPKREPEPEPEPEEEMHLPRDTDETIDLDGTDAEAPEQDEPLAESGESQQSREAPSGDSKPDGAASAGDTASETRPQEDVETGDGTPESASGMERLETPGADGSDLPDADSASMSLGEEISQKDGSGASPIPGDALGGDGGIQALEDEEMDAIRGESPVSEIEERRIRMANEYLARMKRQIVAAWNQPDTANARHKGEIRFSVDSRGYLRTSRVHLPSGHEALDESALRAVRAVNRYRVPDSPSIVRQYYQNLRFTYSGAPVNNDQ